MENGFFLDLDSWARKQHFEFFKTYDHPWFNITAPVSAGPLKSYCKDHGLSFYTACLYVSLWALNQIPEMRYRIRGDRVWCWDRIHGGSAFPAGEGLFKFGYFNFQEDVGAFFREVEATKRAVLSQENLEPGDKDDLVHFTATPWIAFSSVSHARRHQANDCIPKLVFGKYEPLEGKMALAIECHHALVDGFHVGRFFELMQKAMDEPATLLS